MPSLRDRFFTPKVAYAIVSPSAIVATGAAAALGIIAFGPLGVIAGVLGLAARVGLAIPRGAPRVDRIDPFVLDEPWRRLTQDALAARRQFNEAVGRTAGGPIKDRLTRIGETISAQVDDAWATARAGHELSRAAQRLETRQAVQELDRLRASGSVSDTARATEVSLVAQIEAAQRMSGTITQTNERLQLLNARLDEAVSRCIELSVGAFRADQFAQVENDLGGITHELDALRQAVDDTQQIEDGTALPGTPQAGGSTG